jgi:hypothetical protein
MTRDTNSPQTGFVHGSGNLTIGYWSSLILVVLTAVAAAISLLNPDEIYPTDELRQAFFANDVVNLVIGLPTMLIALWLTLRKKLIGLLFWPGALMFLLYTYMAYLFSMPMTWYYLLLLGIVALSFYTLVWLLAQLDVEAIGQRLDGRVPVRLSASLLILFGLFVFLRVFAVIANVMADPTAFTLAELTVLPPDFLISPAWILGGILLWRRKPLGYTAGLGLLFQASMLFIGLIAFLLVQPLLIATPFDLTSTLTVALMSLVVIIPLGLYLRGIATINES